MGMMDKINKFSRRNLSEEEVYIFPLVLCGNEVDRDIEQFTIDTLNKLADMFIGKTIISDHNPKSDNQIARIFDTAIKQTDKMNTLGETYSVLIAMAYMVRSQKNSDIILDIESGIKKEVSVGVSCSKMRCSICNKDYYSDCRHNKNQEYEGKKCHVKLENPIDAYEVSFVAIPSQRDAGVTKKKTNEGERMKLSYNQNLIKFGIDEKAFNEFESSQQILDKICEFSENNNLETMTQKIADLQSENSDLQKTKNQYDVLLEIAKKEAIEMTIKADHDSYNEDLTKTIVETLSKNYDSLISYTKQKEEQYLKSVKAGFRSSDPMAQQNEKTYIVNPSKFRF